MEKYLKTGTYINWDHPNILKKAKELSEHCDTDESIAKSCFTFVRDKIKHSSDHKLNPVTVTASEVLLYETGYCYAKSHLLAALLRANKIPAGLCYQRLTIQGVTPPFCLHGLNAVYLKEYGWYRIDARGNKREVNAQFSPPEEKLAFQKITDGESDLQGIWPEPLSIIVDVLEQNETYIAVCNNLPDIELF